MVIVHSHRTAVNLSAAPKGAAEACQPAACLVHLPGDAALVCYDPMAAQGEDPGILRSSEAHVPPILKRVLKT